MRIVWGSKYEERAIMPTFFAILFDIFFMCSFQVKCWSIYPFPIDLYGLNSWFMIPEFHHGPNEAPGLFQVIFTFAKFSCIVIFLSSNTRSFEFISIGNELAFIARTRIFQVSQV